MKMHRNIKPFDISNVIIKAVLNLNIKTILVITSKYLHILLKFYLKKKNS